MPEQLLYRKGCKFISARIRNGTYQPDQQLPSERELSSSLNISRMTARNVYIRLEQEGLVYRKIRRGWFVTPPRTRFQLMRSVSFVRNIEAEGKSPGIDVLETRVIQTPSEVKTKLQVATGESIYHIRRLLHISMSPALIETLYLPCSRFPELLEHDLTQSLQGLWESEYEVTISRSEMSLKSAMLNADECALLGVEPGSMGIHLQQVHYDQHGQPFSINTEDWRNDVVEFSISVNY